MAPERVSGNFRRICQANYAVGYGCSAGDATRRPVGPLHAQIAVTSTGLTHAIMRHSLAYRPEGDVMPKETKRDRLRKLGVLNPRPDAVRAPGSATPASLIPSISSR